MMFRQTALLLKHIRAATRGKSSREYSSRATWSLAQSVRLECEDALNRFLVPEHISEEEWRESGLVAIARSKKAGADYQLNSAFALAKQLRQSPAKISKGLASTINSLSAEQEGSALIEATPTKQGFVNLRVSDAWLVERIVELSETPKLIDENCTHMDSRERILVDFASPNYGKELHPGHLRSSILGDALCNILEYSGHSVKRVSHVGDMGLPVAMLIAFSIRENRTEEAGMTAEHCAEEMGQNYVKAKHMLETDSSFRTEVDGILKHIQRGCPDNSHVRSLWESIGISSRETHSSIFSRLGVSVTEAGESTYISRLEDIVDELKACGLAKESQGALCVFPSGVQDDQPPLIVQKSDGSFLYATTDLAALKYRLHELEMDRVIYVTDAGQSLHFDQVFGVARDAGWLGASQVHHIGFGLVTGADGKKLSSRKGVSLSLEGLLDAAVEEARKTIDASLLDPAEVDTLAESIAISALRFYDLSAGLRTYKLSLPHMLAFKGKTATYVQYALTRLASIRRKGASSSQTWDSQRLSDGSDFCEFTASERDLALAIAQYGDAVQSATSGFAPQHLCDYLLILARNVHTFYDSCQVAGSDKEMERIAMCKAAEAILHQGLRLLGVEPLERM